MQPTHYVHTRTRVCTVHTRTRVCTGGPFCSRRGFRIRPHKRGPAPILSPLGQFARGSRHAGRRAGRQAGRRAGGRAGRRAGGSGEHAHAADKHVTLVRQRYHLPTRSRLQFTSPPQTATTTLARTTHTHNQLTSDEQIPRPTSLNKGKGGAPTRRQGINKGEGAYQEGKKCTSSSHSQVQG